MTLLLIAVLFTVVYVVQSAQVENVILLKYDNQPNIGNGNYYFTYKTSDGTSRTETGTLGKESDGSEALVVTGSYSYIGDNGRTYLVSYGADKGGYHILQKTNVPEPVVIEEDITKNVAVGKRINSALLGSLVGGGIG